MEDFSMFVPDKSCMQFEGYRFDAIHFELTQGLDQNAKYELSPTFSRTVSAQNDNIEVQLSLNIESTPDNPAPFSLRIAMTGKFVLTMVQEDVKLREQLINDNTVAIMFPFLRSAVSTLTTTANFPPLILPVINLSTLFAQAEDEG